jgi:hypothetical protein
VADVPIGLSLTPPKETNPHQSANVNFGIETAGCLCSAVAVLYQSEQSIGSLSISDSHGVDHTYWVYERTTEDVLDFLGLPDEPLLTLR